MGALGAHRPQQKTGEAAVPARADHQETGVGACFHKDVGGLAVYDTGLGLNPCRVRSLRRSVDDFLGHFLERLVEGLIKLGSETRASVGDRGHVPGRYEPEPRSAEPRFVDCPVKGTLALFRSVHTYHDCAVLGHLLLLLCGRVQLRAYGALRHR